MDANPPIPFGTNIMEQLYLRRIIEQLEEAYQSGRGGEKKETGPISDGRESPLDYFPYLTNGAQSQEPSPYYHDESRPASPFSLEESPKEKVEEDKPGFKDDFTAEDAEETVHDLQLANLLEHSNGEVSWERRERFQNWQLFHQVELWLYHHTCPGRTDNVDYGRQL